MRRDRSFIWCLRTASAVAILLVGSLASAQTGAIAGVVKDETGAVLPGVTVEATSPALIEKVRSATTDGAGQFKITDLPIGAYKVTFSLPGFSTLSLTDIQLTTGFTATANAIIRPGALEENITVSGAAPVVDVQNIAVANVLSRETLDVVPTGHFYQNYSQLVPGMTGGGTDVGGSAGNGKQTLAIHGGRNNDQQPLMNGMNIAAVHIANGGRSFLTVADGDIEEMNLTVAGLSAEVETGGVAVNLVPKTGSNTFHGSFLGTYGHHKLQSQNVDDELAAQGVATNQGIKYNTIITPSFGGPIMRDKLWFFGSYEMLHRANYINNFENLNPTGFTYVPDKNNQSVAYQGGVGTFSGRVTYQINSKSKVTAGYIYANWCDCTTPSATSVAQSTYLAEMPEDLTQIIWTSPVTNRLLLDVGASFYHVHFDRGPQPNALGPSAVDNDNGIRLRSAAVSRATFGQYADIHSYNYTVKGDVSYVTGSHAFKAGVFYTPQGDHIENYSLHDAFGREAPYQITLSGGKPTQVEYLPMPLTLRDWVRKYAVFVQDQWTTHHLTINAGVRWDRFDGGYPDGDVHPFLFSSAGIPSTPFPGARVMSWKDVSPRLGLAYDVFGDGKTALKVGVSRYFSQYAVDLIESMNPAATYGGTLVRSWHDDNGDFYPDGDPLNAAANGELGPSPNTNFGKSIPALRFDEDWRNGFAVRPYQWEATAGVQRQVVPRVSVSLNYFRRWYGNFIVTDNFKTVPADYDTYCITTPNDTRLPSGGNQKICGFFDVNPSAFGAQDFVQTSSAKYGKQIDHWNGVDLTMNVRLPAVLLQGGLSTGKEISDTCDLAQYRGDLQYSSGLGSVQNTDMCHLEEPMLTQYKIIGSYQLPWYGIQLGATYQNTPGPNISATYTATNALIKPSLGRDLSAGTSTRPSLNIVAPGTLYGERLNQMDLLFTKNFRMEAGRNIKASIGVYNAFNANTVLSVTNAYGTTGANWLKPGTILQGRLIKFEGQLSF